MDFMDKLWEFKKQYDSKYMGEPVHVIMAGIGLCVENCYSGDLPFGTLYFNDMKIAEAAIDKFNGELWTYFDKYVCDE